MIHKMFLKFCFNFISQNIITLIPKKRNKIEHSKQPKVRRPLNSIPLIFQLHQPATLCDFFFYFPIEFHHQNIAHTKAPGGRQVVVGWDGLHAEKKTHCGSPRTVKSHRNLNPLILPRIFPELIYSSGQNFPRTIVSDKSFPLSSEGSLVGIKYRTFALLMRESKGGKSLSSHRESPQDCWHGRTVVVCGRFG